MRRSSTATVSLSPLDYFAPLHKLPTLPQERYLTGEDPVSWRLTHPYFRFVACSDAAPQSSHANIIISLPLSSIAEVVSSHGSIIHSSFYGTSPPPSFLPLTMRQTNEPAGHTCVDRAPQWYLSLHSIILLLCASCRRCPLTSAATQHFRV